jgi:L-threonylcarbamoyladenylate synthase
MALHMNLSLEEPQDSSLVLAAEVVQAGGVIVYPTDTIYGIGANAWNPQAVGRVQEIKKRTIPKPILIVVDSIDTAYGVTDEVTSLARRYMDAFWPGPLTLVLKASLHLPEVLVQGRGTIGVRVPSTVACLKLLTLCGCPLTSTSTNVTGERPCTSVDEIERTLGPGIDLFLDAGSLVESKPSTVLDVSGPRPRLLREGVITLEQLLSINPHIDR